jgi:ATP-dependent DNA helicase RecQ
VSANIKQDIYFTLKKYWGHDGFRPLQEDIILSVLTGNDTLALLPTGGGKSLCFQLPGLILGGTTLVISPLISLMNDQVENLKKKGLSAVAITSAMNFKQIDIALNNAALGHVQFLYISPERLQNENFRQQLSHLPISLIAVDEAHCISQWGYDFRPSYLKVAEIRSYFPKLTVIALTASATKQVVEDIQTKLQFKNQHIFRQSFNRTNLRYVVQKEEDKAARLLKIVKKIGGSGIVYVRNRKRTEELTKFLLAHSISCGTYHAGLKPDDRKTIQQNWIDNKLQVICATNAFGMGIDKPDVRFVVHLDLPDSPEAYFQEAGRAGRDGKAAYATLLYNQSDLERLDEHFLLSFPEPESIKQTYTAVCNYYQIAIGSGLGLSVEFDIEQFCKSYNLHPVTVYNSLKFLERENYLALIDNSFEPSKCMIISKKDDLYNYQIKHSKYESLIKALLRSYGGLFEDYVFISERDLAYRSKMTVIQVKELLHILDQAQILSYAPQTNYPKLIFTENRINTKHIELDSRHYQFLKEQAHLRIQAAKDYATQNHICRQVKLLHYFNEFNYNECGYCDVCLQNKPKDRTPIKEALLNQLKQTPQSIEQLKQTFSNYPVTAWVSILNELVDTNQILTNKEKQFYVKEAIS